MRAAPGARFVGRAAELGVIGAELAAARAGRGRLVLLRGEPGVGKTRLALALAERARAEGACVAWGRCHEREGAPVYWPWLQALSACASEAAPEARAELAELLPLLRSPAASGTSDVEPGATRFERFERVASALAQAARVQPLVLVLDDLHWADSGSLLLLEFVARELASQPILILATQREGEPQATPERARLHGAVSRLGRGLALAGLARDEVADLLGDALGRAPEPELVDEVVALTDGNAFFVIEVAHLLETRAGDGPRVPPGVQELLRRRLEPLSARTLRALQTAAVSGREFGLDLLAAALDEPPAALADALAPALALGIVRERPGALRRYAFSHALLREALYEALAPAARSALHAAVAGAIEARGDALDDGRASALAHHWFEAARAGDPAKAVRYACEAGEQALRLYAFEPARTQFERALLALALAPDPLARARACAGLGDALYGSGAEAAAEARFAEALELARGLGGALFADTVMRMARARAQNVRPDLELNALLEEALERLPPDQPALRARLLARLAAALSLSADQAERRRRLADEACALARGLGDPAVLSFALSRRLHALCGPGELDERLALSDELLRTPAASRAAVLEALMARVDDQAERGDRLGLDEALDAFEQRARSARDPAYAWSVASFRAAIALLEGRLAEAESLAQRALALGRKVEARRPLIRFAQQLFQLRGWQDRLAEVEPLLDQSAAEGALVPAWHAALSEYYCTAGRTAEARREFEALAVDDFAALPHDATWLVGSGLIADSCVRLGDARRAPLLYAQLLPYQDRIAVARPLIVLTMPIAARLGGLATLLGRLDDAERHFAHALEIAGRMRALPWQAEIRHRWAELAAARGDHERARRLLDEAEAVAKPLGLALLLRWIAQARAELPAATASQAAPSAMREASMRRDGELWTLVFEGRTTRLRDMVGLAHVAKLVAEPGRELHARELAGANAERRGADGGELADAGDAGELLDARARQDYEQRLRDASEELAEAKRDNDAGRIDRLGAEIELLAAELSRGFGLRGRARRASSAAERARVSVTRAIKYALERVAEHDPALAEHLRAAVRTGNYCVYAPSSRDPVRWLV